MKNISKKNNENLVQIEGLNKSFGNKHVLKGLSIQIKEGQLFSFLGLNGAGKSTLVNIIAGLLSKDSGKIYIDGLDLDKNNEEIKKKVGILFQYPIMDPLLTVKDNIQVRGSLYKLPKTEYIKAYERTVNDFKLHSILKTGYGKLSGGQQKRVNIARSLFHSPRILFLDEPTTGLDPINRKLVWDVIDEARKTRKLTVFLTTHYMEEANNSDYVVIIDDGKVVASGTPSDLKEKYTNTKLIIYSDTIIFELETKLKFLKLMFNYKHGKYTVEFDDFGLLNEFIVSNNHLLNNYEIIKGTIDEVFLNTTGKGEIS